MSRVYIGIDTSNYRTSAAVFDAQTGEYYNSGRLLDVKHGTLGLRQSEALFQHTLHLHEQIANLPKDIKINAVCVSTRPRAVEGSYMPCFLAGENVARSIASVLNVPCFTASHQQGHLVAAAFSAGKLDLLNKDLLAWHLSGGTTELLFVKPDENGMPKAEQIGGTSDIAAGQLVDRAGVLLGLQFPCGAELEQISNKSEPVKPFAVKVNDSIFSLSGMQNKVEQMHKNGVSPEQIARFTIETITYAVDKATKQAKLKLDAPVLCAGGVMSNKSLQKHMSQKFNAFFASAELSGDNAVGAAILAAKQNGENLW